MVPEMPKNKYVLINTVQEEGIRGGKLTFLRSYTDLCTAVYFT